MTSASTPSIDLARLASSPIETGLPRRGLAAALRIAFAAYTRGAEWLDEARLHAAGSGGVGCRSSAAASTLLSLAGGPGACLDQYMDSHSHSVARPAPQLRMGVAQWMELSSDLGLPLSHGGPLGGALLHRLHAVHRGGGGLAVPAESVAAGHSAVPAAALSYADFVHAFAALTAEVDVPPAVLVAAAGRHGAALRRQQLVRLRARQQQHEAALALQQRTGGNSRAQMQPVETEEGMQLLWPLTAAEQAAEATALQQLEAREHKLQSHSCSVGGWVPREPPVQRDFHPLLEEGSDASLPAWAATATTSPTAARKALQGCGTKVRRNGQPQALSITGGKARQQVSEEMKLGSEASVNSLVAYPCPYLESPDGKLPFMPHLGPLRHAASSPQLPDLRPYSCAPSKAAQRPQDNHLPSLPTAASKRRSSSMGPASLGAELALLTAASMQARRQQSCAPRPEEGSAASVAVSPRPSHLSGASLGLAAASGLGHAGRLRRASVPFYGAALAPHVLLREAPSSEGMGGSASAPQLLLGKGQKESGTSSVASLSALSTGRGQAGGNWAPGSGTRLALDVDASLGGNAGSDGGTLATVLLGRLEKVETGVEAQGRRVEVLRSRVRSLEAAREPAASPTAAAVAASAATALTRSMLGGALTHEAESMSELARDMRHRQSAFERQLRELQRDLEAAIKATAHARTEAATATAAAVTARADAAAAKAEAAAAKSAAKAAHAVVAALAATEEDEENAARAAGGDLQEKSSATPKANLTTAAVAPDTQQPAPATDLKRSNNMSDSPVHLIPHDPNAEQAVPAAMSCSVERRGSSGACGISTVHLEVQMRQLAEQQQCLQRRMEAVVAEATRAATAAAQTAVAQAEAAAAEGERTRAEISAALAEAAKAASATLAPAFAPVAAPIGQGDQQCLITDSVNPVQVPGCGLRASTQGFGAAPGGAGAAAGRGGREWLRPCAGGGFASARDQRHRAGR
ncbi:hypothetical protein HYH02_001971 [Chlamydomonas schloesseri]|uniref:Uncharacterized protein n=1 Tax=Chlamydomonas schloesseri TaxID=2026947 RepID=A0A835WU43_9CHLO|nr:hypothetical protein HYH02_001971 [Chlamydomonas schloesseri]|eukprot:KAG2453760.1 hypothetical protein HYH02_001971 [Chlamydomonas schloesseri]